MEKQITKTEFDDIFKLFKRFLKEEGKYSLVIKYLFPKDRTKKDMIDAINSKLYTSFRDIFNFEETLGVNYQIYGHDFWEKNIRDIHNKWKIRYDCYVASKNVELTLFNEKDFA
jgi:hypothetical protein